MKPGGGGKPTGDLADAIKRDFGSFEKFSRGVPDRRGDAVRLRAGRGSCSGKDKQARGHQDAATPTCR